MIVATPVFEGGLIGGKMFDELDIHDVNLTKRAGPPAPIPLDVHRHITNAVDAARPSFLQPIWVEPLHQGVGVARGSRLFDLLSRDLVRVTPSKLLAPGTRAKQTHRQGEQSELQKCPWVLVYPSHDLAELSEPSE